MLAEIKLFGRDITLIPCFRNSFLYGIGGGIGVGLLAFLGTSRPGLSTHIGFGSPLWAENRNILRHVFNVLEIKLFGRDITQIPCFRNSFLYGIGGGIGVGLLAFLGTSRPGLSTHIGFGTFFCGTICYWSFCRYQWSVHRFEQQQLQAAMRKQALYEGTDVESELFKTV